LSYDPISPIDGRYRKEAEPLARYFSEGALNGARVRVELAYLRLLVKHHVAPLRTVPKVEPDLKALASLEEELGHDVKAVEVYIRNFLRGTDSSALAPFVHLGLTSEDTNSLAFAILLKSALEEVLVPAYASLATQLSRLAEEEASTAMVARTHGRPAVPTTFGKEMAVFAVRVAERVNYLRALTPAAKFSGAVGTYASFSAMGELDWPTILSEFVKGFGVEPVAYATQVVPGERLSDILHGVINVNQLISSLSRDLWLYQTLDYVHFLRPGKVSSSTMPQKVNPVDLENAEGQADVSNSLLVMIAYRMQQTRLQRDLSDSVVRRMVGQGLAHSLVACSRLSRSLRSMRVEKAGMGADLRGHPEVLAEREQIRKRLAGDDLGYEKVMKSVESGSFSATDDPASYLGRAPELARKCPAVVKRLLGKSSDQPSGRGG
jgi:adenylosuccinate lyase